MKYVVETQEEGVFFPLKALLGGVKHQRIQTGDGGQNPHEGEFVRREWFYLSNSHLAFLGIPEDNVLGIAWVCDGARMGDFGAVSIVEDHLHKALLS